MPVDPVLAFYGDSAFYSALVLYLVAMVLHTVEYAAGRGAASTAQPVAAAGAAGGVGTLTRVAQPPPERPSRSLPERAGRVAGSLTVLAAAVHAVSLALRGLAAGRVPWGNMYEFTSAICFVAVVAWLVLLVRQRVTAPALRELGGFLLLPVVILLTVAGTVLYAEAAPLVPALNSYWIAIHVSAASIASGVLLVAGVASALYLVRLRFETRQSTGSRFAGMLPGSALLDRLAYRTTVVAVPIWTFMVITGAIWAESAWGRYWGWDPKETVALIVWVIYACYLHARSTAGWRGARSAWINILGFAALLFNLFFINIVIAGLHSYAGL